MCGIVGILHHGRGDEVAAATVIRMRDTLLHRGPDGEGVEVLAGGRVGLGHRRLAIVDLAHGAQPMYGRGGACLVFNGEIYNYPSLKRSLEGDGVRFDTNCDTEVILRLYERYGRECLSHLNGMFAFALWDPAREELFFARDRVGEKPFYWTNVNGAFLFASEIKALLAHPDVHRETNARAVNEYLTNLVVSPPETLFSGIYKLPAGAMGAMTLGGDLQVSSYWSLDEPRRWNSPPLAEAASQVRAMLDASVHERLMSDVPVGVLLSGGLDSTTLVALLRERAADLATFSVGFGAGHERNDEREHARRVAREFGTPHHEIEVSESDGVSFLTDLVHHQDEPLGDPVCIPLHFVCGLAQRNGVKVVLAGEGADELFWGYPSYKRILDRRPALQALLRAPRSLRRAGAALVPADGHPRLREFLDGLVDGRPAPLHMPLGMTRSQRERLLRDSALLDDVGWTPRPSAGIGSMDLLGFDTQEYEFGLRLPELLLMRIDRFSMANSVEARVPFLDPRLVEYVYRLSPRLKLAEGVTKVVMKQAIADVVPRWVMERPKQGFSAPVDDWMTTRFGAVLLGLARTPSVSRFFNADAVRSAVTTPAQRRTVSVWPILNFALWHRYWIEGESLDEVFDGLAIAS